MKNAIVSYLNNKKLLAILLIPLFFLSLPLNGMESSEEPTLTNLPPELQMHVCLTIAPEQEKYQEAIKTIFALSATCTIFNAHIKSNYFTKYFTQALCNKFDISKLTALHGLHTQQAQKKLTRQLITTAQYAYNMLDTLKGYLSVSPTQTHTSLTENTLGIAYNTLFEMCEGNNRKSSWKKERKNTQKTFEDLSNKPDRTNNNLMSHNQITIQAAQNDLYWIASNIHTFIKKDVLDKKLLENETVFSLLHAEAFDALQQPGNNFATKSNRKHRLK